MNIKLCITLTLALTSSITLAQDEFEEESALSFEDQYISIATGYEEVISRAPAVATIINQQQIDAMGAKTLDDVLASVPGIHVGLSSHRLETSYVIRGLQAVSNAHVLVLLNGVPLTQLFKGDRGWMPAIPATNIKQIEVIRGPGSAIYGADAFTGVINVITKRGQDIDGTIVQGGTGSFDTTHASILYGKDINDISYTFAFDYYKTQGDDSRIVSQDRQTIFDNNLGTNASLASGPNGPGQLQTQAERFDFRVGLSNKTWTFNAWNWVRSNVGLGPGESQTIDTEGAYDVNNYLMDLTYQPAPINDNLSIKTTLSYMKVRTNATLHLFPDGTRLPLDSNGNITRPPNVIGAVTFTDGFIGAPSYDEEHTRLDTQLFITDIGDHRFRIGLGGLHARLSNIEEKKNYGPGVLDQTTLNGPLPATQNGDLTSVHGENRFISANTRELIYLSLQDQWYLNPYWDLAMGVRYDHYSDFGSTTNPRLALIWHPSYDLTTKLLYGHAFRAPPFAQLYLENNPVLIKNEDLKPEKMEMLELSINYQINFDVQTQLSIFQYKVSDSIENAPSGQAGVSTPDNVGKKEAVGFEWELSWKALDRLTLSGHYAFHDARDSKNGGPVGNSPKQKLFLFSQWEAYPNWHINTVVNWISDIERVSGDPRAPIDDYVTTDFIVAHSIPNTPWAFKLKVNNAFNDSAKEPAPYEGLPVTGAAIPDDYPLAERSFLLSAEAQF